MDGTALYAEEDFIPDFQTAREAQNMLRRKAGQSDGFVCKSTAGRVVRLIQNYDSDIYTSEPEELPAQWGFVWSTDPEKALPFIAISTSPYSIGECCTDGGKVWRSTIDNNVWAPTAYPQGWEEVVEGEGTTAPTDPGGSSGGGDVTTYPDFQQPTGAHDAYSKGDRVMYNGHVYESLVDSNVWAPDAYLQGWKMVQ